jgi:cyclopropane fatty-acyl-phospholipid synthase-like methyltransferase
MSKERYNLDETYTESFFGWGDNAAQQKVLAEYFVSKIVERFNPKYVLDVGCGTGQWLDEYRKYNIKTKGVEGSGNAFIEMSEETKDIVLQWDLRDKIEEEDCNIDLVQSFEVAEHIEEEYVDEFVHNLIKDDPDIILLTAAPPNQHGIQHVNCKEKEYWMKKMKDNGYLFNQELLNEIKDWGTPNDCPQWWRSNLMVFI